jgi:branched-chain amino acid transport system ATP-binding protein
MLTLSSVTAGYGDTIVLRDVNFSVNDGEVVALLGPNGAGKTTLLRTATGFVKPRSGRIEYDGESLAGNAPYKYVQHGICHLPEGRGVFPSLSVRENLVIQARGLNLKDCIEKVAELFPALGARLKQSAGSLSGGEQQMLALARGYITNPKVVVVDEPSLGLAPRVVDQVYDVLARFVERGMSLVVVEQYVQRALALAHTVYILGKGEVIHRGDAKDIGPEEIYARYLRIES